MIIFNSPVETPEAPVQPKPVEAPPERRQSPPPSVPKPEPRPIVEPAPLPANPMKSPCHRPFDDMLLPDISCIRK